jgi:purine nucleosidase
MRIKSTVAAALTALAALTMMSAGAVSADAASPPVVIFDSDMDFDDAATLAYLAQEDRLGRIDLRAVTVVNNGAGLPGRAIRHARCLVERLGLDGVQIADGSSTAPNAFPSELRQTFDRVLESVLPGCTASEAPSRVPAPDLIERTLAAEPNARLIVTGPLSNAAAASPAAARRVTSMGGAVRVGGGLCCGTPPEFDGSQEFNYWIDPASARAVLRNATAPVRLVPLDATNDVPITTAFVDRLRSTADTTAANIVLGIVTHPEVAPFIAEGQLFWWDPLAAMSAIHNGIVDFDAGRLDVVQDGPSMGRTVLSQTGRPAWFGTAADTAAFEQRFIETLNHP